MEQLSQMWLQFAQWFRPHRNLIDWFAYFALQMDWFWWSVLGTALAIVICVWLAAALVTSLIRDFDLYW